MTAFIADGWLHPKRANMLIDIVHESIQTHSDRRAGLVLLLVLFFVGADSTDPTRPGYAVSPDLSLPPNHVSEGLYDL